MKFHRLLSLVCIFMKLNHMRINSKMLWDAREYFLLDVDLNGLHDFP